MATPEFILSLREKIGHEMLWLSGVTVVVLHEGQVLCVRRSDNGQWNPVTGIIDPGEQPVDAAEREVLEETSLKVRCTRLVSLDVVGPMTYPNGDRSQYLDLCFAAEYLSGEPFPADGENIEAAWFPLDALPPLNARFQRAVQEALAGAPQPRIRPAQ
ncbi:NUDIX hydrolase [Dermabacteraceae bacterium P13138]